MSDELAMEIIENLSEELGQKELRIMKLEKECRMFMSRNQDNERKWNAKEQFYQDITQRNMAYRDEGAWYEWTDGIFNDYDIDDIDLKVELFLDLFDGREVTAEEYIDEIDDSNDEAIKNGALDPMNMNDIQKMIDDGDIIYILGAPQTREVDVLNSNTRLIVDL